MVDPERLTVACLEYTKPLFNIAAEPYLLSVVGTNHINKHKSIYATTRSGVEND